MKLSQLKKNPANPRLIRDANFERLKKSITEFGAVMMPLRPIVYDEDMVCLGGNMRLSACLALGMKEVPDDWVKFAGDLTDEQKREFVIRDNNSLGEYDWDLLSAWDDLPLSEWGVDIPDDWAGADGDWDESIGGLPDGEKSPFQQMTFTVSDEQAEQINTAMKAAKGAAPFAETGNENSNGNALARICEAYQV